MGLTFQTLIIVIAWFVIACFVIGLTLWFMIFDPGISGTLSRDIAEDANWTPERFAIPALNAPKAEGHISRFAEAPMNNEKPPILL